MKRKTLGVLSFLALLMIMILPAHAETLNSVTASVGSDNVVAISGMIGGGAGQVVSILVHDPNGSIDYLNTCLSETDGTFGVSYSMTNNASGRYTVTAGTAGAASVAEASFLFGADSLEATATEENGVVKIIGTSGAGAGRLITVRITAPDGTEEYVGSGLSGAGGVFGLSYALENTQTGKFTAYVGAAGIAQPVVCYFLVGGKTEMKASIDEDQIVTIEGTTSTPEKPVSVRITDPKGELEFLSGINTEKDGTFRLSYTMLNEAKGRYAVSVSTRGLDEPMTAEFCYGVGLHSLTMSAGSFEPSFDNERLSYTASVENSVDRVRVTPVAIDPDAEISVNGVPVPGGSESGAILLNEGANAITIAVVEKSGAVTTYSISVTRERSRSANADLNGITLSSGSLKEAFSSDRLRYTADVANAVTSISVIAAKQDPTAMVQVIGGSDLVVGENTITITVTAQAGNTKVYIVTVTRAPSDNANLKGLILKNENVLLALAPSGFTPGSLSYSVSVGNTVSAVTVAPEMEDPTASVSVACNNGAPITPVSGVYPITIVPGTNTITILVTAQNNSTKTYTVTVLREYGLSGLTIRSSADNTDIPLSPDFLLKTIFYTANVGSDVEAIIITPSATTGGTVGIQAGNADYNIGDPIPLNIGRTAINVMVTVPGAGSKTYTVEVTRARSSNANLGGITINHGTLVPGFDRTRTGYAVSVGYDVTGITVGITTEDAGATFTVNGVSGYDNSIPYSHLLQVGDNIIHIDVKPQDESTVKRYTITITRAMSDNANLSGIVLSSGAGIADFSPGTLNYTVTVPNAIASIRVTPTAENGSAAIAVNVTEAVSSGGTSGPISLSPGNNIISSNFAHAK